MFVFTSNYSRWLFCCLLMLGLFSSVQAANDCSAVTEISPAECESLLELYDSTDGANWENNEGWNVTSTPCSWYGVTCGNAGISRIHLQENKLTGTIPNFSSLPNLKILSLRINEFLTGSIPNFSGLPNLNELVLDGNQLTDSIPDFSNLPNLQKLYLSGNQLTGSIPDFNNLPNLYSLQLAHNKLEGTIPNFSNIVNLKLLILSYNQLVSTIPNFNNLPNLYELSVSNNQLTDSIPNFSNLPKLEGIYLNYNQLTGSIPNFSNLPKLESIYFQNNKLIGTIPNFNNLPNLNWVELHHNQLKGIIPNFNNLPNFYFLAIDSKKHCRIPNVDYSQFYVEVIEVNDVKYSPECRPTAQANTYQTKGISPLELNMDAYDSEVRYNDIAKIIKYDWTSSDGQSKIGIETTMRFTNVGKHSISLVVTDNNGFTSEPFISIVDVAHSLTIQKPANGKITGDNLNCGYDGDNCYQEYDTHNYQLTLNATPKDGYKFIGWSGACSGISVCSVKMDKSQNIRATFELKPKLNVYSSKNGAVTGTGINCGTDCEESYNQGTSVTINAEPKPNYKFSGWSGACSNKNGSCTLTMNQEQIVTAIFEIAKPNCSYSISSNSRNHNTNAIEDTITITASASECKWTAKSNVNWISITDTNDNTITYSITENTKTEKRSGTLTVAEQNFTIIQAGKKVPNIRIEPTTLRFSQ